MKEIKQITKEEYLKYSRASRSLISFRDMSFIISIHKEKNISIESIYLRFEEYKKTKEYLLYSVDFYDYFHGKRIL